jgi:uncharacterized membrane protein YqhA
MRSLLNASRFMVLAAVLGSLASAAALFAYGLVDTIAVIARTIAAGEVSTKGAKGLMLHFIEIFDLFLLGTVMLIMALSLYELFIDTDLKLRPGGRSTPSRTSRPIWSRWSSPSWP